MSGFSSSSGDVPSDAETVSLIAGSIVELGNEVYALLNEASAKLDMGAQRWYIYSDLQMAVIKFGNFQPAQALMYFQKAFKRKFRKILKDKTQLKAFLTIMNKFILLLKYMLTSGCEPSSTLKRQVQEMMNIYRRFLQENGISYCTSSGTCVRYTLARLADASGIGTGGTTTSTVNAGGSDTPSIDELADQCSATGSSCTVEGTNVGDSNDTGETGEAMTETATFPATEDDTADDNQWAPSGGDIELTELKPAVDQDEEDDGLDDLF